MKETAGLAPLCCSVGYTTSFNITLLIGSAASLQRWSFESDGKLASRKIEAPGGIPKIDPEI